MWRMADRFLSLGDSKLAGFPGRKAPKGNIRYVENG